MTFSSEIVKLQSERYTLVRLRFARDVSALLASQGSNVYTYSFPNYVTDVEFDEVTGTEVSDTPNSNHEWNYDRDNNLLTVYDSTAPNASTNIIIMEFALFFTNSPFSISSVSGTVSGSTPVKYLPRLLSKPKYTQASSNQIYGVVSAQSETLSIADSDGLISSLMTSSTSVFKRQADAWIYANGQTQKLFDQLTVGLSFNNLNATFRLNDRLAVLLENDALFGDKFDEAYMVEGSYYTNIAPDHVGKPVPIFYTVGTPAKYTMEMKSNAFNGLASNYGILTENSPYQAYRYDTGSSLNKWAAGRIPADFDTTPLREDATLTEPDSVETWWSNGGNTDTDYGLVARFKYDNATNKEMRIGDNIQFNLTGATSANDAETKTSAGNPYNGVVIGVDYSTAHTYYFVVCDFGVLVNMSTLTLTDLTVEPGPFVCFTIHGQRCAAIPNYNYTFAITSDMQNNKNMTLTFYDDKYYAVGIHGTDFEDQQVDGNFRIVSGWDGDADPLDNVQYQFNYNETTPLVQENYMQELIEGAGLTINTASFATAGTDHTANVYSAVPSPNLPTTLGSVGKYAEDLLRSVGGILYYSAADEEVFYKILNTLGSPSATITESDIIAGSFNVTMGFRDVKYQVTSENRNVLTDLSVQNVAGSSVLESPLASSSDDKARVLFNSQKTRVLQNIMEDFTANSRDDDIMSINANPLVVYSMRLPAKYLEINITDLFTLEHDRIIGGGSSEDCMIISYTKDEDGVTVKMTPLRGL